MNPEVFEKVQKIISQHLGVNPSNVKSTTKFDHDLDLRDDSWDKELELTELKLLLQDEFEIQFDSTMEKTLKYGTVGELANRISMLI